MIKNFTYQVGTKVYFGQDQLSHLGEELAQFGKRVLLVYGGGSIKKIGLYDRVMEEINKAGLEVFELPGIEPNPRVQSVREGRDICREKKIDVILAVGGGSSIDASKFISAAYYYDGDPWDFQLGKAEITKALPLVTILTLSATGSEMDAGGMINNPDTNEKMGRKSELLRPRVSFLDPTNTFTVSPFQTAAGSADIFSHTMETYFNEDENFDFLDDLMEGLMKTVIKYGPIAMAEPDNYNARANLMWASSWAINDFLRYAHNHSWSNHPIEHELSAFYTNLTHGLGLAIVTPRWCEYVLDETSVDRFYKFGVNVFDIDRNLPKMEVAKKSIEALKNFFYNDLKLTSNLTELGIDDTHFEEMAKHAEPQFKVAYRQLKAADLLQIYKNCL